MVSFEIFVKSMPHRLSELKVLHSFCFAFEIPDCVCPLGSLPLCHRHCQDKENEKVNVLSICRSFLLSREFQNLKIHMGVFSHHFPGRLKDLSFESILLILLP